MKCRALYTFIGSSIKPFMLINFTRLCSESYIIGGMTDSCLICFSLFCGTWTGKGATVSPIENAQPYSVRHVSAYGNLVHAFVTHKLYVFKCGVLREMLQQSLHLRKHKLCPFYLGCCHLGAVCSFTSSLLHI